MSTLYTYMLFTIRGVQIMDGIPEESMRMLIGEYLINFPNFEVDSQHAHRDYTYRTYIHGEDSSSYTKVHTGWMQTTPTGTYYLGRPPTLTKHVLISEPVNVFRTVDLEETILDLSKLVDDIRITNPELKSYFELKYNWVEKSNLRLC